MQNEIDSLAAALNTNAPKKELGNKEEPDLESKVESKGKKQVAAKTLSMNKSRVPENLPEFVEVRLTFSTYVSMPGHPETRVSREFPAGQIVDDPRDIAYLIQNRAIIAYPRDYKID